MITPADVDYDYEEFVRRLYYSGRIESCLVAKAGPEPEGEWMYELDESGVRYADGLWPFCRRQKTIDADRSVSPSQGLRLVPSTMYKTSPMPHYAMMQASPGLKSVYVTFPVYVRTIGDGAELAYLQANIALYRQLTWYWVHEPTGEIAHAAEFKRQKIVDFLSNAIRERDLGIAAPTTAAARCLASQIAQ